MPLQQTIRGQIRLRITNSAREPQESTGYQKIDEI